MRKDYTVRVRDPRSDKIFVPSVVVDRIRSLFHRCPQFCLWLCAWDQDRLDSSLAEPGFGLADGYKLKLLHMSRRSIGPLPSGHLKFSCHVVMASESH